MEAQRGPSESDGGKKGRTHQRGSRIGAREVMSRQEARCLTDVSGGERELSGRTSVHVCGNTCLPGEEGSQLREVGTRVGVWRSLAEHDVTGNLREHSEA